MEPTDLSVILASAIENLKISIQESGAQITSDALPTLRVDPMQFVLLFQNLLSNAMKFRGNSPPLIRVGATHRQGEWVFSVTDNGIGIDPEHAERIFMIFQRLHPRDRYPGTGMGLAICKKIVEQHGGRIWVESSLGKGATFFFTLPDQPS